MVAVITSECLKRANEMSLSERYSHVSMDERTVQISCDTVFGTQTLTVSRETITKAGRGFF